MPLKNKLSHGHAEIMILSCAGRIATYGVKSDQTFIAIAGLSVHHHDNSVAVWSQGGLHFFAEHPFRMKCPFTFATRVLVRGLLATTRLYEVLVQANRDSTEQDILKAYRKVILENHPDKGGNAEHFKTLPAAKESWDNLRKAKPSRPLGWQN